MIHNDKILSMMKFCEPMREHTTFKIGGPADIWAQPKDLESLMQIIGLCRSESMPVVIAGNGSNLLIKDKGIKACVINLNTAYFKSLKVEADSVTAGAGLGLSRLINVFCKEGLSGLESLAGIPATVGGALAMNAGGKAWIGDFIEEVSVMDGELKVRNLDRKELVFRYRGSNLGKYIVLNARFKFRKSNSETVKKQTKRFLDEKIKNQDLAAKSAGCVFKNPNGASAGRLIDLSGFKGKNVGDAFVSEKHTNFIINAQNATCSDVLKLMDKIIVKVKKDHGVRLEPEIKVLG